MTASSRNPKDDLEVALEFAAESLGPSSYRYLNSMEGRERLLVQLQGGQSALNAALAQVHSGASTDPSLAEEFLSYFMEDLLRLSRASMAPSLRRHFDSGDLVQSVFRDLWPEFLNLEFRNRASFLALLAQRIRWKASNRARDLQSAKRREDRRSPVDPDELGLARTEPSPPSRMQASEQRRAAEDRLRALPEDERELLRLHFQGLTLDTIAERLKQPKQDLKNRMRKALRHLRQS
ncbi:MAG: sigma-70 family RNA polymerase sigma factor [Planctomycetota bacterium]|nr:MAG: sigma-70 family RNA polymerase sigma factor [Planctomycetota bacterium]